MLATALTWSLLSATLSRKTSTRFLVFVPAMNRAGRTLPEYRPEFDSRRGEFASLDDFLRAKAEESEWVSTAWAKFGGSPRDCGK